MESEGMKKGSTKNVRTHRKSASAGRKLLKKASLWLAHCADVPSG